MCSGGCMQCLSSSSLVAVALADTITGGQWTHCTGGAHAYSREAQ